MALQTVAGQTITEPVTLAALKARIKLTSTADDAQLTGLITAAREFAEHVSHRCLAPRQFVDYRDKFPYPNEPLIIPAPPLVSLDLAEYLDDDYTTWTTWDPSEYWVAANNVPAVLQPKRGFTYPATIRAPGCVRITFTAGAEISQRFAVNIADIAVFMYENAGVPVPTSLVKVDKIYIF